MGLLADLASGKLGLVVAPPDHLTIEAENATSVSFNAVPGQGWWLFFFPDLHLDLDAAHDAVLDRDLKRHTRVLFETMFAQLAASTDEPSDRPPRTDDASWSPLIEFERFDVAGGAALTVLHRMSYQPGHEVVMGHTLVPVRRGLFEARWLFQASLTGYREAMLHDRGADNEPSRLSQQAMDDPVHDASFPDHLLTLARAARSWHVHGGLRVTEPPLRLQSGSRTIEALGCTITPPPRFVFSNVRSEDGETTAVFTRVSFAGTDGIEHLLVTRTADRIRGLAIATRLLRNARTMASVFAGSGYTDVECDARLVEGEAPSVAVTLEGSPESPGQPRGRMVARVLRDRAGQVWWVALDTTVAVPLAELADEVDAVVATVDVITEGKAQRVPSRSSVPGSFHGSLPFGRW